MKTGYFLDHVAFGATVYTSNPIYAPDDRDGTLPSGARAEWVYRLRRWYAELRIVKDVGITVGAKGYDTPFINRNDTRMTPNTFEAIVFQGRVKLGTSSSDATVTADGLGLSKDGKEVAVPSPTPAEDVASIKYGAGYFYAIKERNASQFVSMAQDAGADIQHGVWSAGALYEKGKFNIGAIEYYCADVINIAYAQTGFELPLAPDWRLRFAGQYPGSGQRRRQPPAGPQFLRPSIRHQSRTAHQEGTVYRGFHPSLGNCQSAKPVERLSGLYQC